MKLYPKKPVSRRKNSYEYKNHYTHILLTISNNLKQKHDETKIYSKATRQLAKKQFLEGKLTSVCKCIELYELNIEKGDFHETRALIFPVDGKIARITNELIVLALIPTRLSSAGQISLMCKHEFKRDHRQVINLIEMYLDDETIGKINTYVAVGAVQTQARRKYKVVYVGSLLNNRNWW